MGEAADDRRNCRGGVGVNELEASPLRANEPWLAAESRVRHSGALRLPRLRAADPEVV